MRAQRSAVYNPNRLTEKPIPEVEPRNLNDQVLVDEIDAGIEVAQVHDNEEIDDEIQDLLNESQLPNDTPNEIDQLVDNDFKLSNAEADNSIGEMVATEIVQKSLENVQRDDVVENPADDSHQLNECSASESIALTTDQVVDAVEQTVAENSENCEPHNEESHSVQNRVDENPPDQQLQSDSGMTANENSAAENIQPEVVGKNIFEAVQVEVDEASAFGDLFNGAAAIEAIRANLDASEKATINEKGQIEITKYFADLDDIECTHVYGQIPVPRNPEYTVKLNDSVSGNIPYKENVSFDFAYINFNFLKKNLFLIGS